MTTFDVMVLAIVGFSTLFAFVRGVIRELIALVAWVIGLLAAVTFTPVVADWLPAGFGTPSLRYVAAFAIILIGALLAGAVLAFIDGLAIGPAAPARDPRVAFDLFWLALLGLAE